MTYLLVWILVVGRITSSTTSSSSTQFGPFADEASCRAVEFSTAIKSFDKECIQVKMVVIK